MTLIDQVLTVLLCGALPLALVIASAILGTRARLRFAEHILRMRAEGKYQDWSKPPLATRIRTFAILGLIVIASLITSVILLSTTTVSQLRTAGLVLLIASLLIGFVLGGAIYGMIAKGQ